MENKVYLELASVEKNTHSSLIIYYKSAGDSRRYNDLLFQIFNTPNMYLILFSISSFAISTTLGMNQVLIPTLQQLFNLNSKQIGKELLVKAVLPILFNIFAREFKSFYW